MSDTARKVLTAVYGVGFFLSLVMLLGSLFIFNGADLQWARYGIFISFVILPTCFIISLTKSRASALWLVLPLLPLAAIVYFLHVLGRMF